MTLEVTKGPIETFQDDTERSVEYSKQLIAQGSVVFVQIPRFLYGADFPDMIERAALGITPDVQFIIVDCSNENAVRAVVEDVVLTYNQSRKDQITTESVLVLSPNIRQEGADVDSRIQKKLNAYEQLLRSVQQNIDSVHYFGKTN